MSLANTEVIQRLKAEYFWRILMQKRHKLTKVKIQQIRSYMLVFTTVSTGFTKVPWFERFSRRYLQNGLVNLLCMTPWLDVKLRNRQNVLQMFFSKLRRWFWMSCCGWEACSVKTPVAQSINQLIHVLLQWNWKWMQKAKMYYLQNYNSSMSGFSNIFTNWSYWRVVTRMRKYLKRV